MSDPDGTTESLIVRALDPAHSVVVEACAGSGKTWLLASRIVRLLLAGVAPGEILAITFTRKAAREIEERVVDWLRLLATAGDDDLMSFLAERGVAGDVSVRRIARGLYERVLAAQPGLTVNTFHGWFLQLVDAAPLSANLAGMKLAESDSQLFDELWQSFAAKLQRNPQGAAAQGFVRLLALAGLEMTQRLIRRAFGRRSEWLALDSDPDVIAEKVIAALQSEFDAGAPGEALAAFFAGDWAADFQAYLGFLEMSSLATDQTAAAALRAALSMGDAMAGAAPTSGGAPADAGLRRHDERRAQAFEHLRTLLLTKENALRSKKPSAALDKRFTPSGAARFLDLHASLGGRVIECIERQTAERILAFNRDACVVFAEFLAHVEAFKQVRRQIDFVDAEWKVLQLLRDESTAAFLQARLDARYRHVLLDEFQDTNPLQWQILRAWFDAYSDDSRPRVFLVGDPKQSIYRFRRAEPRLFAVAADFMMRDYAAVRCEQDVTRRNARPVIDVVNAVFLDTPEFSPFRKQSSLVEDVPGWVALLPLAGKDEIESSTPRDGLRDPLTEPVVEPEDRRRRKEAEMLAQKIGEIVGQGDLAWQICDKDAAGNHVMRPARYDDILVLVRSRTGLSIYERALSAAGIPFNAGSRGGLLTAVEIRDMAALIEFLVTPLDDLKLAHALRSPVFACSDEELMQLAWRSEPSWWHRLNALVADGATPRLTRAARLLTDWQVAADRLPAHDLLDRIYHEGEVLSRYRCAVPAAMAAGVIANLRELLLLALDVDGGRYPSLPRFIDKLHELRDADANDAPDEGEIESQQAEAGRVRILTIHGAKGLEAPIVWLLGANAPSRPADPWDVLVDWPPEDTSPRHYSFFGRKEDRGVAREALFDAELAASGREELNLLYVAMTRARQVFIASGVENARSGENTHYRLLERALQKLGTGMMHGAPLPLMKPSVATSVTSSVQQENPFVPVGVRREPAGDGERFGMLLHALIERRTEGRETAGWWKLAGFHDDEYRRAAPVASRLLATEALQKFFDPTQYERAWNEVDITAGDGVLRRIDRLVETGGDLWVLDYKSSGRGTERLEDYKTQVRGYCVAVAGAFPARKVRGALIFADGTLVEVAEGYAG